MRNKHEKLTIACDEDGRYKQLPFNERASRMTGLDLIGTIVLFINPADAPEYDSEDSDFDNVGDERRENAVTFNLADANALLAEVVLLK